MTIKQLKVLRAHIVIANGSGVAHQPKREVDGLAAMSIRVPLTAHIKRRLGIPTNTHAYASLIIEPLGNVINAVDMIADQLLGGDDPLYTPKKG